MGGAAGNGGDMPASKTTCAQYAADYETALAKAKECDVKADACGKMVPAALSGCKASCQTYVQDDSALTELRRQWEKDRCAPETCVAAICINIAAGSCKASNSAEDAGSKKEPKAAQQKGTCTDGLIVL
jgi:hypothetical protein